MKSIYRLVRFDWPMHFTLLFTNWMPDNVLVLRFRGWLVSFFLGKCGKDLRLGRNITFYNPRQIFIGDHVYIAFGNWFSAADQIVIDNEVIIGPNCIFASANHTPINTSFRYGEPDCKPIFIGKGSWIGGNCAVTAGTSIGAGSVVGANTAVTKIVPDSVLFAGCPGRVIKKLEH